MYENNDIIKNFYENNIIYERLVDWGKDGKPHWISPVHSPSIDHIEVVRSGSVRRAKLYYLRGRVGKGAKVKEKL